MGTSTKQGLNQLYGFKKNNKWTTGLGALLPESYKKFYAEWKLKKPTAVHYIPKEGIFERDEVTGIVTPIQDIPIQVMYPPEHDTGIWGGEGIIKGFTKQRQKRRVPHFWMPQLYRSVLHSVVLDKYMSVVVTNRTMNLIHESKGFDHYILKTPACDLKSKLALKIKRNILKELHDGCPSLMSNTEKQNDVLGEYKCYLEQYTADEIDWYGLTFIEAITKLNIQLNGNKKIVPQKMEFRQRLIEQLKEAGIKEAQGISDSNGDQSHIESSWLSKMNPFGKKHDTK